MANFHFSSVVGSGCLFQIPDPNFFILDPGSRVKKIPDPGSGTAFKYFEPKKLFLSSRNYDPGYSSRNRIPDPDLDFLPIPDPAPQHCFFGI